MSEAKLFVANGFNGGITAGIRGDSFAEFESLAKQVYGDAAGVQFARDAFDSLRLQVSPAAAAIGVLDQAIGVTQVVSGPGYGVPASTVGQAAPQPYQPQAPVAQPQSNVVQFPQATPPGVTDPGPCAHGPRVFVDKPAKGRPWRRFECALEWRPRDDAWNAQRCKPVNA